MKKRNKIEPERMIAIKIPQRTFTKEEIRDWSIYEQHLKYYPTVAEYLESIFKKWTTTLDVPLSILWFRQLLEHKLNYLESLFTTIFHKNSAMLNKIKIELEKENSKYADDIINKIISLNGELFSTHFLAKHFTRIEPLDTVGDFLCDKKVTVSVKSKTDTNFNLEIIENYICGLLYDNNMDVLKDYKFHLQQIDGIDYHLRKAILVFLRENLIDFINQLPDPQNDYDYNEREAIYSGFVRVKGDKYIHLGKKKIALEINYSEKRFEIILSENKNKVTFPTDVYYADKEIYYFKNIEKSIDCFLEDFDKKSVNYDKNKFWGLINIAVSYKHQYSFENSVDEIRQLIKNKIDERGYKIIFYFYPVFHFEMKRPIIFEFN